VFVPLFLLGAFLWACYLTFAANRESGLFRSIFFFYQVASFCLTQEDQNALNATAVNIVLGIFDYRFQGHNGVCFFEMNAVEEQLLQLASPCCLLAWSLILYSILVCVKKFRTDSLDELAEPLIEEDKSFVFHLQRPPGSNLPCFPHQRSSLVSQSNPTSRLSQALVLLCFTAYSTILKLSTTLLACTKLEREIVLSVDGSFSCYSWPWIVGLLFLISSTLGFVAFLCLPLLKNVGGWRDDIMYVLKAPYQNHLWFWEVFLILQRFLMGMINVFLFAYPYLRSALLSLLLFGFWSIHLLARPFVDATVQWAHSISLLCLFITAGASMRQATANSFATDIPTNDLNRRIDTLIIVIHGTALTLPLLIGIALSIKNLGKQRKNKTAKENLEAETL